MRAHQSFFLMVAIRWSFLPLPMATILAGVIGVNFLTFVGATMLTLFISRTVLAVFIGAFNFDYNAYIQGFFYVSIFFLCVCACVFFLLVHKPTNLYIYVFFLLERAHVFGAP